MICPPCERQLRRRGRHRAHRGCRLDVIRGNVAGPCWCPACHWISAGWRPPVMAVTLTADTSAFTAAMSSAQSYVWTWIRPTEQPLLWEGDQA